jgi:hypothetical protein
MQDAWMRPLSPTEDRLVWQTLHDAGSALRRDPAMTVELLAILFSEVISGLANGCDQTQAVQLRERLAEFLMDQAALVMADDAAPAMAQIPVAGHA